MYARSHLLMLPPLSFLFVVSPLTGGVSFDILGDLPGGLVYSSAAGVSGDGSIVVGRSSNTVSESMVAFRWENGVMTSLGDLSGGSHYSFTTGISGDGHIIIGEGTSADWNLPVRWIDGEISSLSGIWPMDISTDGSVMVGRMWDNDAFTYKPARWNNGSLHFLEEIPESVNRNGVAMGVSSDGTVIVGQWYYSEYLFQAFRWENGLTESIGFLPGTNMSTASAASSDGSVIVGQSGTVGFYWKNGAMHSLGIIAGGHGAESSALDVSGDGTIIVGYSTSNANEAGMEAVMWRQEDNYTAVSLNEFLSQNGVGLGGFSLTDATGVSDDGSTIVGTGYEVVGEEWIYMAYRLRLRDPAPAWAHFPIHDDGRSVDTGNLLGWIDVDADPWIYCYILEKYLYCPKEWVSHDGSWAWVPGN